MSDTKISALTATTSIGAADLLTTVQGGTNKKITYANALTQIKTDTIASSISNGDTTHSPDGNSVFDALALKYDASNPSSFVDAAGAVTAVVTQVITNGVTNKSPSEDAVFDALALKQNSLGFTAEDVANKSTDGSLTANSTTLYPSQSAVKTYADGKVADAINNGTTTIAPSQNAVFDALALKYDASNPSSYIDAAGAVTAVVSSTITNGVANKSPSEDAVFDALALKYDASNPNSYVDAAGAVTAVVTQVITNGVTNKSPSEDAVYDALALKAALAGATYSGAVIPSVVTLSDAATIAVNAALGNQFTVTLSGNRTLGNPTGAVSGQLMLFAIRQDGTGSRTLAYDTKFRFGTDITAITLTTAASKTDYIGVRYHSADDKFDIISVVKGF